MKKIAVCLEHRFYQYDNKLYTRLAFPYPYWKDYLSFFDEVTIIARVKNVSHFTDDMVRVDGERVSYDPLPYYHGLKQFILMFFPLVFKLLAVAFKYDHFLLRSGNSTNILWFFVFLLRKPYLREYPGNIKEGMVGVVGDKFWVRVLATVLDNLAKVQSNYSKSNSFVSNYCKDIYGSNRPSYTFSSFKASEIKVQKQNYHSDGNLKIVSLGRLEGEKGHALLLESIYNNKYKKNIEIHLIGDGSQSKTLKSYAEKHDINCIFYGALTNRDQIFNVLLYSDIFIIPSLTEGMPRALLEAMTIGLPCIGTNVGGIPEVVEKSYLYEPKDFNTLNDLINGFYESVELRESTGNRNKQFISDHFGDLALQCKKHAFWESVYE